MGKKRKHWPTIDEVLDRPWCYYCEKDFDDQKILVSHQKAKHFKCEKCNRRLNTAGGLSVHMSQVHKESLQSVHNALPNRSGLEHEIFAMEGIPEDVMDQHKQRVVRDYYEKQAEHLSATGNPLPGSGQEHARKKPKLESMEEMKARAREFVAQKKAGKDVGAKGVQGVNGYNNQTYPAQHPYPQHPQSFPPGQQQFAPPYGAGSPAQHGGYAAPPQGLPDRPPGMPQDPRLRAQRPPAVSNADIDDLIASTRESRNTPDVPTPAEPKGAKADKKSKKEKPSTMVFEDEDVTPEELFSRIAKFSFNIQAKLPETVHGEAGQAAVTGPVDGQAAQDS